MLHASESQALATLPAGAVWSCSFGNPGEGGFVEYYRALDGSRYRLTNGAWNATRPFSWRLEKTA